MCTYWSRLKWIRSLDRVHQEWPKLCFHSGQLQAKLGSLITSHMHNSKTNRNQTLITEILIPASIWLWVTFFLMVFGIMELVLFFWSKTRRVLVAFMAVLCTPGAVVDCIASRESQLAKSSWSWVTSKSVSVSSLSNCPSYCLFNTFLGTEILKGNEVYSSWELMVPTAGVYYTKVHPGLWPAGITKCAGIRGYVTPSLSVTDLHHCFRCIAH